jgi:hypothetical protein
MVASAITAANNAIRHTASFIEANVRIIAFAKNVALRKCATTGNYPCKVTFGNPTQKTLPRHQRPGRDNTNTA